MGVLSVIINYVIDKCIQRHREEEKRQNLYDPDYRINLHKYADQNDNTFNEHNYAMLERHQQERFMQQEQFVHSQQRDRFIQEQHHQQQEWMTEESIRSVTPFEMGGYDMTQGNSFNNFENNGFEM